MFSFSVALSCHHCNDACINPMCLCSPTQRGGLLLTVELSSFNIQTFLVPQRALSVLGVGEEVKQWLTLLTDKSKSISHVREILLRSLHLDGKSSYTMWEITSNYICTDYSLALNMQLLSAFNQRPSSVVCTPLGSPFSRLMWAAAPHRLCSGFLKRTLRIGVERWWWWWDVRCC